MLSKLWRGIRLAREKRAQAQWIGTPDWWHGRLEARKIRLGKFLELDAPQAIIDKEKQLVMQARRGLEKSRKYGVWRPWEKQK